MRQGTGAGDGSSHALAAARHLLPCLQVASHAQKYFIRLNSLNKKDKRRSSIHDITSAGLPGPADVAGEQWCKDGKACAAESAEPEPAPVPAQCSGEWPLSQACRP